MLREGPDRVTVHRPRCDGEIFDLLLTIQGSSTSARR